jgi:UDP-3-O-[3-hydroxymyristoyl] glucosamine N-acyltransferase
MKVSILKLSVEVELPLQLPPESEWEEVDITDVERLSLSGISIHHSVVFGERCRLFDNVKIGSGVIIGSFVDIEDGCNIAGNVRIADNVTIGRETELNNGWYDYVNEEPLFGNAVRICANATIGSHNRILGSVTIKEQAITGDRVHLCAYRLIGDWITLGEGSYLADDSVVAGQHSLAANLIVEDRFVGVDPVYTELEVAA